MKNNFWFFVGLGIIIGLAIIIPGMINGLIAKKAPVSNFLIQIIGTILQIIIGMGAIKIALNFCDNQKSRYRDLFGQYKLFFKYIFASILYGLIVAAGLILLIAPGIIWSVKFGLFQYFIIDKKTGPIDALKKSAIITKGAKWNLFLFRLLLVLINLLGFFALLIGFFVTAPVTMVASAFVYRKLSLLSQPASAPIIINKPLSNEHNTPH